MIRIGGCGDICSGCENDVCKVRPCDSCGVVPKDNIRLTFLEKYKKWYCHRCLEEIIPAVVQR